MDTVTTSDEIMVFELNFFKKNWIFINLDFPQLIEFRATTF